MYAAPNRMGGAGAQYRAIDVSSKIEGASPHRLVAILYEELILALAGTQTAIRRGDPLRQHAAEARALAIVKSLENSLDHRAGGEIAAALTSVYGEVARLTALGGRAGDAAAIGRAQQLIGEIADAWNQIG